MALASFLSPRSIIWRFAVDWCCVFVFLRYFRKAIRMTKFHTHMPIRMQMLCTCTSKSMKYAQHAIRAISTRLFVTLLRFTKANTLSTVRSRTCRALTSTKTEKALSTGNVRFLLWKMAQPHYTINGHTTKPTRRSAIAINAMM